jgi:hypothetical protein
MQSPSASRKLERSQQIAKIKWRTLDPTLAPEEKEALAGARKARFGLQWVSASIQAREAAARHQGCTVKTKR